jgi:hypothetical protein
MGSPSLPVGLINPFNTWGLYGNLEFVIQQLIAKVATVTLVKVISCTNSGAASPIGTVNVQPLVNQTDAAGNPIPHTTIFNVPYLRIQSSGGNALILDPVAGDLGICLFASRDLSKVISTQAQANPGSDRRYSYADALYLGVCLSKTAPTQYVQFSAAGITIVSPTAITLQAPQINLQGAVNQSDGTMTAQTDVIAGSNSISLVNHVHTSEAEGDPTSPPIP